jgi:glycosyltransferase involved in cell wall biosynthesis
MLTAFAEAWGRGLNHELVILGSGSQEAALKELADKLGVADRVHFKGQTTNPFAYMKHARALVLSSVYEGFGLVLLEAMTIGVPCISTDCPSGPAEILGNGEFGTIVPMKDAHALANAMLELASDPVLRQTLIDKAYQRAGELSLGRMTAKYLQLFDDVRAS